MWPIPLLYAVNRIPSRRLPRNFPGCFEGVGDMSRGSRRHGSCYGEVTGKFRGFKPSRHVEMVWKIPVTSRQQGRLRSSVYTRNGDIGDASATRQGEICRRRRGQINGDVMGLSRTCRARYGEVGIMEFGFYSALFPHRPRSVAWVRIPFVTFCVGDGSSASEVIRHAGAI